MNSRDQCHKMLIDEARDDAKLDDILSEGLAVVFCGINPGMSAALSGHHFVNRSNRFWRAIYLAGFTPEMIPPEEDRRILDYQCGLTTFVSRPTRRADELAAHEFSSAAAAFRHKVDVYRPRFVAFLGKAAYAALSGQKNVAWGPQDSLGRSGVWVLPNPSGLNRSFSLEQLVAAYRELYRVVKNCDDAIVSAVANRAV